MKNIFVCSQLSGDIEHNTEQARRYCIKELLNGNAPFAPHLLYPQMLDENRAEDRELGIACGLSILKVCDAVHVWTVDGVISSGMRCEINFAVENNIPVYYTSA